MSEQPSTAPLEPGEAAKTPSSQRWWILAVLCLVVTVVEVDSTVVNVALPTLANGLRADASDLAWINDAYILTFASFQLIWGRLGDRFGHKRLLQVSLLLLGASSLLCAYATSTTELIIWRALLGVGGAGVLPASLALVTLSFDKAERPKAFGIWSAMTVLGLPLGPVLGGWLLEHFWWGSVFLINVPLVVITLIAAQVLIRTGPPAGDAAGQDVPGVVLATVGVAALLFGVIEGPRLGWGSVFVLGAFVVGVVLLVAFFLRQNRAEAPVFDPKLLKLRTYTMGSLANSLSFFTFTGVMFVLTQYLQAAHGYSPLQAGLGLIPLALLFTGASTVAGPVVKWIDNRGAVAAGLALIGAGMLVLVTLTATSGYAVIATSLALIGFGAGLAIGPGIAISLSEVPPKLAGVASAAGSALRQIGGAIGVAVLGSIVVSTYASELRPHLAGVPGPIANQAQESVASASAAFSALPGDQAAELTRSAHDAYVSGLHVTAVVAAAIALVSAALIYLRLPRSAGANAEELV
ncbi:MFS transporter [Amycolatopsis vastitatis]|uniref:MFS transporter n=1 Tax=Amycolatopsis vastitatis TaxID=1905142 RepID=UPI00130400CE|nr:MFS transporter [Amycolatopsis vastitatis]